MLHIQHHRRRVRRAKTKCQFSDVASIRALRQRAKHQAKAGLRHVKKPLRHQNRKYRRQHQHDEQQKKQPIAASALAARANFAPGLTTSLFYSVKKFSNNFFPSVVSTLSG